MHEVFFKKVLDDSAGVNHSKGREWLQLLLNRLKEDDERSNSFILSKVWLIIGDIHYMNGALRTSLSAYRTALIMDRTNVQAYFEIASINFDIGCFEEAIDFIKKGAKYDPKNIALLELLEEVKFAKNNNEDSLYNQTEDKVVQADLLANGKCNQVLELANDLDSLDAKKARISSFGCLKEIEKYLKGWQDIFLSIDSFELNHSDWFYMPIEVYESSKIWSIFLQNNDKIETSVFESYPSLINNYELTHSEMRSAICDYHIYLGENNLKGLRSLNERFPLWQELYLVSKRL